MKDPFVVEQWQQLLERLHRCARHHGDACGLTERFEHQASNFAEQPPDRYAALLRRVAEAAQLAQQWQEACREQVHDDAEIDEASDESFPASDPPAWTTTHA